MATKTFLVEVHTHLPLTDDQVKDVLWAIQSKVKELEFDAKTSPKGNVIQRAYAAEFK